MYHLCLTFIFTLLTDLFHAVVEGFIEAKIERFGEAIVNKVIEVCNTFSINTETESAANIYESK